MSPATRAATAARTAPGRTVPAREGRPAERSLRVESRAPVRSRRRGLGAAVGAVVLVGAALVSVAGANALLAREQVRLDALRAQASAALARQQDLELERAELLAPSRIVAIAEGTLHMTEPATVSYLAPVDPGPSVAEVEAEQARAAAAPAPRSATTSSAHRAASPSRAISSPDGAGTGPAGSR